VLCEMTNRQEKGHPQPRFLNKVRLDHQLTCCPSPLFKSGQ
jgi:hypothetical protein